MTTTAATSQKLLCKDFYGTYHGHTIPHLSAVCEHLREEGRGLLFLLGDSSLDNKHWLFKGGDKTLSKHYEEGSSFSAAAINGYEGILDPPRMLKDVAYWVNAEFCRLGCGIRALNASVEESTIADRAGDALKPQDTFVRENLNKSDVLVVCVGGNDVALRPSPATLTALGALMRNEAGSPAHTAGMGHFTDMFRNQLEHYLEKVTAKAKPLLVVACMVYFPCEERGGSWADAILTKLGYDQAPQRLQALIQSVYIAATKQVQVKGTKVVTIPFFRVLDSKDASDYCARVEPSCQGGEKMGRAIAAAVIGSLGTSEVVEEPAQTAKVPDVDKMRVKELKALIKSRGLSLRDCVTKSDLRKRAHEALQVTYATPCASSSPTTPAPSPAPAAARSPDSSTRQRTEKLGPFSCEVIGPMIKPELVVIFFHGYNATATNFAPLAPQLMADASLRGRSVLWIFPQAAPKQEWWHLDLMQMMMGMQGGPEAQAKLIRTPPVGLDEARANGTALIKAVCARAGVPMSSICIAGFSQGASMAIDTALAQTEDVAGVSAFSPYPIVVDQWHANARRHKGLKILLSHGKTDNLIPFAVSSWIRGLVDKVCKVQFHSHGGGHEVGNAAVFASTAKFYASLCKPSA